MILKALYDYYIRLREINPDLPPYGMKEQEISYLIIIDENGNFLRIEDRRIDKKRSQKFLVVSEQGSTSGIKPFLMFHNVEYVLGIGQKGKEEKALKKHIAFKDRCFAIAEKYQNCKVFQAIVSFYKNDEISSLVNDPLWETLQNNNKAYISFLLQGEIEIAASKKELSQEIGSDSGEKMQYCLVTGKKSPIVRLVSQVRTPDGKDGTALVSFQENSGYDSYGKKQCYNAPISCEAEEGFSNALKHLLQRDSKNKYFIGNRTHLFWASKSSESGISAETNFFSLFGFNANPEDDPDRRIELAKEAFRSIFTGKIPSNDEDRFFIMSLDMKKGRTSVVYWNETTVKKFAKNLLQHFEDMEIIANRHSYGLYQIMKSIALNGEVKKMPQSISDATIRSIVQGLPYPYSLLEMTIHRIRSSQEVKGIHAAILKGYLNRINNNKKITFMVDTENSNAGYLCGRLLAVLDRKQEKASGGDVRSIKERYMTAASSTPVAVFPRAINLARYYEDKLSTGENIFFEKLIQEILNLIPNGEFPSHLNLQDQGRFFVGYYQQRQAFFQPKEEKTE